jgi:adenosine deaminase
VLTPALNAFIRRMPKVELHLHLEGSITPRTVLELAQKNQIEIPANDLAGVERLFHYRDFGEFLTVFMALARAIVSRDDFARIAYELGLSLATQNVRYAEVMFSPMQHLLRGIPLSDVVGGMADGFARAEAESGIMLRTVFDYGRQYGPALAWYVLEVARESVGKGVVGFSIGGNEIGHPPQPFAEIYSAARSMGLGVMAHAGEVVGAESVWGAVDALGCTRIGHGIRSVDDPALIAHLIAQGVTLDVCPTSNVLTGAVPSWQAHPMRSLYDAGVALTLNTDDPTFFDTTVIDEYCRAADAFAFNADDLVRLVRNAVDAAFLPPVEKAALRSGVEREISALRADLDV